jgi:hypothetical protein
MNSETKMIVRENAVTVNRESTMIREIDASDFWGEPIYTYTRQQAIEDGVLIDAQVGELHEVTRQHFGDWDVCMTAALFALIEKAVNNPKQKNDWKGVWHDICWMSRWSRNTAPAPRYFKVIITGTGRRKVHLLKRTLTWDDQGHTEVTFMLVDED